MHHISLKSEVEKIKLDCDERLGSLPAMTRRGEAPHKAPAAESSVSLHRTDLLDPVLLLGVGGYVRLQGLKAASLNNSVGAVGNFSGITQR